MWALWIVLLVLAAIILFLICFKLVAVLTMGKCRCMRDMTGKTIIITGANAGIGKETARKLAQRNARVILACRSLDRGQKAAADIIQTTNNPNVIVKQLDLCSLSSVRKFSEDIMKTESRLDVLLNNAGAVPPPGLHMTEDHLEVQFASNHFGHFLLTNLLLPLLKRSAPSRIVIVSSLMHILGTLDMDNLNCEKGRRRPMAVYCSTKIANILFTIELNRRLKDTGVTANVLHPGAVDTTISHNDPFIYKILKPLLSPFLKTPSEGAETSVHLALSENLQNVSGKFFVDCREFFLFPKTKNKDRAARLWEKSEVLTGLSKNIHTTVNLGA